MAPQFCVPTPFPSVWARLCSPQGPAWKEVGLKPLEASAAARPSARPVCASRVRVRLGVPSARPVCASLCATIGSGQSRAPLGAAGPRDFSALPFSSLGLLSTPGTPSPYDSYAFHEKQASVVPLKWK